MQRQVYTVVASQAGGIKAKAGKIALGSDDRDEKQVVRRGQRMESFIFCKDTMKRYSLP